MNGFGIELIKMMISQKKYSSITDCTKIMYPDKNANLVIQEHVGDDIRVYKENGTINILCPGKMTVVQEGALAKAIENGTIFDDADTVDNGAKYIELTTLPYKGMCNKGICIPDKLHKMTSIVIGKMDDDGRCGQCDTDLDTGNKFYKDMIDHVGNDMSVADVVKHYVGNEDGFLNNDLRRDMRSVRDEIERVRDIDHEATVSDDEWSYMSMDEPDDSEDDFQEGFIGNMINKHQVNKNRKTMESRINVVEQQYGVKFSEEYKELLYSIDLTKPTRVEPLKGLKHAADIIPYPFHIICDFDENASAAIPYEKMYDNLSSFKGVNTEGLYPVIELGLYYDDEKREVIYSDTEGKIYASVYNKTYKLEEVSSSLSEFIISCRDRKIYYDLLKPGDNKLHDSWFDDSDTEHKVVIIVKSKDGSVIPRVAAYYSEFDDGDDFLGDIMRECVLPKLKELVDDPDEYTVCEIIFDYDGEVEVFAKYKGKKISLNTIGLNLNEHSWFKESHVVEISNNVRTNKHVIDTGNDSVIIEGFLSKRPKKLKPIPRDVIAYITVEMNAIKDSNDQAMLAGYTCSKLELVDFYITVIDTQDSRYIVPHTRDYLVRMQTELNDLLAKILKIKPINRNDRVWKVNLPEGWRG